MLKFILTIILIILVLRMVGRLMMPFMMSEFVKRAQRNMDQQYKQRQSYQQRPQGEIHVDYTPPSSKKTANLNKEKGDFVDFEEIK